jgi:thiol:disulfide interchange protein DsbD
MWMESVKKIFGWVLLAMAAYFLRPALPGRIGDWLLCAVLAVAAIVLITRGRSGGLRPAVRFSAAVLFIAAAVLFFPRTSTATGPAWEPYPATAAAAITGRPSVIEFGAAWCVPCRELDEKTFSDARVRGALSQRRLYKADLTKTGSPEVSELSDRFGILGVPTIVFLDAGGKERTDLRLVGFEGPDAFLARLAKAP